MFASSMFARQQSDSRYSAAQSDYQQLQAELVRHQAVLTTSQSQREARRTISSQLDVVTQEISKLIQQDFHLSMQLIDAQVARTVALGELDRRIQEQQQIIDTPDPEPIIVLDGEYCINGIHLCKNHPPRQRISNQLEIDSAKQGKRIAARQLARLENEREQVAQGVTILSGQSDSILNMQSQVAEIREQLNADKEQASDLGQQLISLPTERELQQQIDAEEFNISNLQIRLTAAQQTLNDLGDSRVRESSTIPQNSLRLDQLAAMAYQQCLEEFTQGAASSFAKVVDFPGTQPPSAASLDAGAVAPAYAAKPSRVEGPLSDAVLMQMALQDIALESAAGVDSHQTYGEFYARGGAAISAESVATDTSPRVAQEDFDTTAYDIGQRMGRFAEQVHAVERRTAVRVGDLFRGRTSISGLIAGNLRDIVTNTDPTALFRDSVAPGMEATVSPSYDMSRSSFGNN